MLAPGPGPWDAPVGQVLDVFHIDAKTAKIAVEHVRQKRQSEQRSPSWDDLMGPLLLENQRLKGEVNGLEERLDACRKERGSLRRQLEEYKITRHHCRYF